MPKRLFILIMAGLALLSGCAKTDNRSAERAATQQDIADLKARILVLESRVQSLEAALPDNDRLSNPQADAATAPTS